MNHGDPGGPTVPPAELDEIFGTDPARIAAAVAGALAEPSTGRDVPTSLPAAGLGGARALELVVPYLRGAARDLGDPGFLAHMDPPTPWVSWVAALAGASSNQNLLHPDTAPAARDLERTVVGWLAPVFDMAGGHLVPGSTVANLTALWAARDAAGVQTVVASADAHLSIRKAATILGLRLVELRPGPSGGLTEAELAAALDGPEPIADPATTALVLTAGTTSVGAIDHLTDLGLATAWTHVDAAWAGPLRFSDRHRHRLDGMERADSVAVSAHKWLFQPKESAVVLFADPERAEGAITLGGTYLAAPNVGLLGSHGTAAAPLAATLLQLGGDGVARLVDHCMAIADRLVALVAAHPELEVRGPNRSGVVAWRHRAIGADEIRQRLTDGFVSSVDLDGTRWLRSVAANPMADPDRVVEAVLRAGSIGGPREPPASDR